MAETSTTKPGATAIAASTPASACTPESLITAELAIGTPRSQEYREGMLDALNFRMRQRRIQARYKAGTAGFDAYFAGNERGHALWRRLQAEISQQTGANAEACHV